MKRFAILLLILSATSSYATPYDLTSNESGLVKNATIQTPLNIGSIQDTNHAINQLKLENNLSILRADLLDMGNLKVTKKICLHAEGREITSDAFSYDVNIGIKVLFI